MPRVFISYSHDTQEHVSHVLSLAVRLRADGVSVVIDQDMLPGGPVEGWPVWSETQVRDADLVLIASSEAYARRYELQEVSGTGLGAVSEARAIRQLMYESGGNNQRFRVILFAPENADSIPIHLKAYHNFRLYLGEGYDELLTWLGSPSHPPAPVQSRPPLIGWPSPLPDYLPRLADRKAELALFTKMITGRSTERILLLQGSSGTGKTILLAAFLEYSRLLKVPSAQLDLKGCPSLDDLFETLRLDLGLGTLRSSYLGIGASRFYALISDFQQLSTPLLLIFDTYEQASADVQRRLESELLPRLDRAPGLVVVISGQQTPEPGRYAWRSLAEVCELQPIRGVEEWRELIAIKWRDSSITDAHILGILAATEGNPATTYALLEAIIGQMPQR